MILGVVIDGTQITDRHTVPFVQLVEHQNRRWGKLAIMDYDLEIRLVAPDMRCQGQPQASRTQRRASPFLRGVQGVSVQSKLIL